MKGKAKEGNNNVRERKRERERGEEERWKVNGEGVAGCVASIVMAGILFAFFPMKSL